MGLCEVGALAVEIVFVQPGCLVSGHMDCPNGVMEARLDGFEASFCGDEHMSIGLA